MWHQWGCRLRDNDLASYLVPHGTFYSNSVDKQVSLQYWSEEAETPKQIFAEETGPVKGPWIQSSLVHEHVNGRDWENELYGMEICHIIENNGNKIRIIAPGSKGARV